MTAQQNIKIELVPSADKSATRKLDLKRITSPTKCLRSSVEDVSDLRNSIARYGLFHPIIVRPATSGSNADFEVVSGMRRFEALKQLGIQEIACQVTDVPERDAFEIALSENLQRKQLDPIEEALAFQHYIKIRRWGHAKDLVKKVGKSEEYINHRLKLLELPDKVLSLIGKKLTPSHAEELSWFDDCETQIKLANESVENKLTVKQLHELAMREKKEKRRSRVANEVLDDAQNDGNDWLPKMSKRQCLPADRILQNSILALKYDLSYLDSCIDGLKKLAGSQELVKFMIHERFLLHEVLDHFVVAASHARNGKLFRI